MPERSAGGAGSTGGQHPAKQQPQAAAPAACRPYRRSPPQSQPRHALCPRCGGPAWLRRSGRDAASCSHCESAARAGDAGRARHSRRPAERRAAAGRGKAAHDSRPEQDEGINAPTHSRKQPQSHKLLYHYRADGRTDIGGEHFRKWSAARGAAACRRCATFELLCSVTDDAARARRHKVPHGASWPATHDGATHSSRVLIAQSSASRRTHIHRNRRATRKQLRRRTRRRD